MENLTSSQVLSYLRDLRHTLWLQGFVFTPEQEALYWALRQRRWDRVKEVTTTPN